MIWAGWPLCIAALVAGSFANTIGALIVTQGIMYGSESNNSLNIPGDFHSHSRAWTLTILSRVPHFLLPHN